MDATMAAQARQKVVCSACRRLTQHFVNDIWAKMSTRLFYKVKVHPLPQ